MVSEINHIELSEIPTEQVQIIDVRESDELVDGIIPGSIHIALSNLMLKSDIIDGNKTKVFYCRSGRRSMKAAKLYSDFSGKEAKSLMGGYLEYIKHQK